MDVKRAISDCFLDLTETREFLSSDDLRPSHQFFSLSKSDSAQHDSLRLLQIFELFLSNFDAPELPDPKKKDREEHMPSFCSKRDAEVSSVVFTKVKIDKVYKVAKQTCEKLSEFFFSIQI